MVTIGRYDALVHAVMAVPAAVRLVGVDGCGGAGKTTFASRLSGAAGAAPVIHTDDFASHDEPTAWWPTMLHDVVQPLLDGRPATYEPYDWVARRRGARRAVSPAPLVIIEGVGATRAAWRDQLAMSIWVETPRAERLRRGLARDGEDLAEFWQQWMVAEDAYVAAEDPAGHTSLVVDGASDAGYDVESEFVIAPAPGRDGTRRFHALRRGPG
jgi:uridine kinase